MFGIKFPLPEASGETPIRGGGKLRDVCRKATGKLGRSFFEMSKFFFRSLPGMNSGTKKKDAHDLKGSIFVRLVYVPFFGLVA